MDRDELIARISELHLPLGEYAVVGSGPLAVRGIREVTDIDLLVTHELYARLKEDGWKEEQKFEERIMLVREPFECATEFGYGDYWPESALVIEEAEVIEGVAFARLEVIEAFKRAYGRPKDERDLLLIGEYKFEHEKEA